MKRSSARSITLPASLPLALLVAILCFSAQRAVAAEIEGVRFAERLSVEGAELRLLGTGLLRYRVFIKGYVAAFYMAESTARPLNEAGEAVVGEASGAGVLGDVPRRLEIEYFWPIPAEKFAEATRKGIAQNTDPAGFAVLRDRIDRISSLYEDVEPGDRYVITYVPGLGTELSRNGRSLGVVEGADFSAAMFAIWVGDRPVDESLREQLLASLPEVRVRR